MKGRIIMIDDPLFTEDDVIFSYTMEDALADGMLVEVTETAREAGFKTRVTITAAAWSEFVKVPDGVECQDEMGRLWDVLNMLKFAIMRSHGKQQSLLFTVFVRNDNRAPRSRQLKAHSGPGDEGEPVITIMLPGED
jgi:hypothetical protein